MRETITRVFHSQLLNIRDKEKILKAAQRKMTISMQEENS